MKEKEPDMFELLHPDFEEVLNNKLAQSGIVCNARACSKEQEGDLIRVIHKMAEECADAATAFSEKVNTLYHWNFYKNHYEKWGESFSLSLVFAQLLTDMMFNIKPATTDDIKEFVKQKLFGKAIRTYMEITALIQAGFPHGAVALVRVLYELRVYLSFIEKNDSSVALAYFNRAYDPLTNHDNNEWAKAAECFHDKKRISFADISKAAIPDQEMQDVMMMKHAAYCKFAHAAPQTINDTFDSDIGTVTIGPLHEMIEQPAIDSAVLLAYMLMDVHRWFYNDELYLRFLFCMEWLDVLAKSYKKDAEDCCVDKSIKQEDMEWE